MDRAQSSRALGKKGGGDYGGNKKPAGAPAATGQQGQYQPASLRQQSGKGGVGAASSRTQNPSNQAIALRADHLLRIATWASANVPPLGALLGARLGCLCETAGVPVPDTPHVICERCESIMQVGVNCYVRVMKNKRKGKSSDISNYVTYFCHFCKHGNAKPGTSKTHLKTKIAQAAARASLNVLGKSPVAETHPVNERIVPLHLKQETEHRPAEDEKPVQIPWENQQRATTEQGGPEAVEATFISKKPLDPDQEVSKDVKVSPEVRLLNRMEPSQVGLDGREGSEAVEMNEQSDVKKKNVQGFAEQDSAKSVERTNDFGAWNAVETNLMEIAGQGGARTLEVVLNKEPLDIQEKDRRGQENAKSVEVVLNRGPSDLVEMDHDVSSHQEDLIAVQGDLSMGLSRKNEQGFALSEDLGIADANLSKETLEIVKMKSQGFAASEGQKSTGMLLNRLPLDLSSKKRRKKKKPHCVVNQGGPTLSSQKGLVVESRDTPKKKKHKGWSTLKELAGLP